MSKQSAERRHFHRIATDKTVVVHVADAEHRGKVVDVSLHGMLFVADDDWRPTKRTDVSAKIHLDDQCYIEMDGEIVHVSGDRIGLRCTGIDLDSAARLRRMIELNLADHDLLERELTELIAH